AIEEKKNLALEKLEEYEKKTAGDPSISPVAGADENVSDVLNAVGDYYETVHGFLGQARESYKGLVGVWMMSREFANFTNYTNTYVGAGGKTDAQGQGSWSAEGAFAWNELSSKAATTIGRGAKLTAGSDMGISASEQMTNTLLAGYFQNYTSALGFNVLRDFFREGDASPIGATLGLQFLDGQANVTVREGAVLESSEGDVSLSAKTDTVSVGIAGSASKTNGKVAVTAMSNVITADVVAGVSVDDEASLISKKKDVSLTAENDASLQSVSASMAWQSGQEAAGAGMAGVAVVLGDMTADVTVADNDGEQNLYNTDGLLSAKEGTVSAKADTDTKSNAIGAAMAGTAAKSEGAKELKPDMMRWLENHNLPEKVDDLLGKGIGKIVDSINEARGAAGAAAGANNPG
ncbi:MAG: hypothetical protein HUK22_08740, partial [Thermoguttaceae bacterium]|nr:hypothetical protein [Thermoguttaceae bacterium]